MEASTVLPSTYFDLKQVADGIYAAIVIPGTGPVGNAGIVDLGDRTLIFDTTQIPQAAQDLRRIAEVLFGRPVSAVVNSHNHLDHVGGNQVFADCDIYSTAKTREIMATRFPVVLDYVRSHPEVPEQIAQQAEAEQDPERKDILLKQAGDYRAFGAAAAEMRMTLPNVTFDESLTLHGTRRTVQLLSYGGGHTPSDLMMYLPEDEVLFIGDLAVNNTHPLIRDGSTEEWLHILDRLQELPIRHIICGHGPVAEKGHLQVIADYIKHVTGQAHDLLQNGKSAEEATELQLPEAYSAWNFRDFYHVNIKGLYEKQKAETGE